MLNSTLLAALDDSISTSLSDIVIITPILPINLFHFNLKLLSATLSSHFCCEIWRLYLVLLIIMVAAVVQTLSECGFNLTLGLIEVPDYIFGLLDDSHAVHCFL